MMKTIPVITIDGPSGCGKGTLCHRVARELSWHILDSGALYRAVAWALLHYGINPEEHTETLPEFIAARAIRFEEHPEQAYYLYCDGHIINEEVRSEACGAMASRAGAIPSVRASLLQAQRDFRQAPGLVTDGRDMGTVVFPDALLKFFLTASPERRAERRYRQLKALGINASLREVLGELERRDERDQNRSVAPLKPSDDMIVIDTSELNADQVFAQVMHTIRTQVTL